MFNTNSEEGMKCHAIKNKRLKQNKYTLRHFVTFFHILMDLPAFMKL